MRPRSPEVDAFRAWANQRREEAWSAGQRVVHVNMDETCIALLPPARQGVGARARLQRCPRRVPVYDATRGEQRSGFAQPLSSAMSRVCKLLCHRS